MTRRRDFLGACSLGAAAAAVAGAQTPAANAIVVDPKPLFDISPHLYMQFMEPLGTNDGSVEAAWDYRTDDWLKSFESVTRDLAPGVIRFGGIFSSYHKWREGVGPPKSRPWMYNYMWGGRETNRVGTHEFVSLCRRVGAEPLYCVNFSGDGRPAYRNTWDGQNRWGDAKEAADWVSYANDPDSKERKAHGVAQPYNIKLWQLGNETSYSATGFTRDEAIAHTIEFAKAIRQRDPSVQLIGWGDWGTRDGKRTLWAPEMARRAGDQLDMLAMHMGSQGPAAGSILRSYRYRRDLERAWEELMAVPPAIEAKLVEFTEAIRPVNSKLRVAITEGHMGLPRSSTLSREWLVGVYNARVLNTYQRHGDMVKISTNADFEGTRWASNAVLISGPLCYMTPVAAVMGLFKKVNGNQAVAVTSCPADLDIAASRSSNRIFLHVANKNFNRAVEATFSVAGMSAGAGKIHEIACEDPLEFVYEEKPDVFSPKEKMLPAGSSWSFPARSVTAVELELSHVPA